MPSTSTGSPLNGSSGRSPPPAGRSPRSRPRRRRRRPPPSPCSPSASLRSSPCEPSPRPLRGSRSARSGPRSASASVSVSPSSAASAEAESSAASTAGSAGPSVPGSSPCSWAAPARPRRRPRLAGGRLGASPASAVGPSASSVAAAVSSVVSAGSASVVGRGRLGSVAAAGGRDPGEVEDQADDVGLLGAGGGLAAEGGGDRHQLVAVLGLEGGAFKFGHVGRPRRVAADGRRTHTAGDHGCGKGGVAGAQSRAGPPDGGERHPGPAAWTRPAGDPASVGVPPGVGNRPEAGCTKENSRDPECGMASDV